jgi:hypothetical protein
MSKRHWQNREYSDCKKTASPACCSIRCCGSRFGRKSKRHNNKPKMRRYYRHATKNSWRKELEIDLTLTQDEIREINQALIILMPELEEWIGRVDYCLRGERIV